MVIPEGVTATFDYQGTVTAQAWCAYNWNASGKVYATATLNGLGTTSVTGYLNGNPEEPWTSVTVTTAMSKLSQSGAFCGDLSSSVSYTQSHNCLGTTIHFGWAHTSYFVSASGTITLTRPGS